MTQIPVKNANGDIVNVEAPLAPGRVAAAASRPVVLSNEDFAALSALHTDLGTTLSGLLSSLNGYVDQLEGYTDGIETLITSTNTKLDTLHTDLATTLAGLVDGLEGILGVTSGAAVITDANGTVQQYLRGLVKRWVDALGTGTAAAALRTTLATDVGLPAGTSLLGKVKTKFIVAAGAALTRPANTTAYTANDAISDNATIGSVTAKTISLSDVNDDTVTIERLRLATTDTGLQGKSVRAFLYSSDPTANSGVQGGDNAAFSNKLAGFIGSMSGTFRTFQDGAVAVLVPDEGARIICAPGTGAKTVWWQLQALDAFTPSANSTTITPTAEGFQGAA